MDLARHLFVLLAFGAIVSLSAGCKSSDAAAVDASGVKGAVDHAPVGVASYSAPAWQRYGDLLF